MGGDDARALADILQAEIDSGRTEAYRTNNASEIAAPRGNTLEGLLTDMLNNSGYVCSPPTTTSPSRTYRSLSHSCAAPVDSKSGNRQGHA